MVERHTACAPTAMPGRLGRLRQSRKPSAAKLTLALSLSGVAFSGVTSLPAPTLQPAEVDMQVLSWNVLSLGLRGDLPFELDPKDYAKYRAETVMKYEHLEVDAIPEKIMHDTLLARGKMMAIYDVVRSYVRDTITGIGKDYKEKTLAKLMKRGASQKGAGISIGEMLKRLLTKDGELLVHSADTRLIRALRATVNADSRFEIGDLREIDGEPFLPFRPKGVAEADHSLESLVGLPFDNHLSINLTGIQGIKSRVRLKEQASQAQHVEEILEESLQVYDAQKPAGAERFQGILKTWKEKTPFQWLAEDRVVYGADAKLTKPFALSQADKNVETDVKAAKLAEYKALGNFQPFGCATVGYFANEKSIGRHDWLKLRLYHLLLLAARNEVLYRMALPSGGIGAVKSTIEGWPWHTPPPDKPESKQAQLDRKRLQVSISILRTIKLEERFRLFESLQQSACDALVSQSKPIGQAELIAEYMRRQQFPVVLLQEVDSKLLGDDRLLSNALEKNAFSMFQYEGKLKKDNSVVLVRKKFLASLGFNSTTSTKSVPLWLETDTPERYVMQRIMQENADNPRQLVVGSVHAGSSAGDESGLKEVEAYINAALAAMLDFQKAHPGSWQLGVIGGDLNVDPRVGRLNILQDALQHFEVHRLTNPPVGVASHMTMRGPLQSQMTKIDEAYEKSIDHIYVITSKDDGSLSQMDSEDPVFRLVFEKGFSLNTGGHLRNVGSEALEEHGKSYKPEFDELRLHPGVVISGFVPTGDSRPAFFPTFLPSEEGLLDLAGSDHLPVTAKARLRVPGGPPSDRVEL